MRKKLQQFIFKTGQKGLLRFCFNRWRELKLKVAFNNDERTKFSGVIFCIDGKVKHGGLADRFHGLLCTYALCKIHHLAFRINWCYPFNLSTFLIPNAYNWMLEEGELSYGKSSFTPIVELGNYLWYKNFKALANIHNQVHLYANVRCLNEINAYYHTDYTYQQLYDELFLPSERLKKKLKSSFDSLPNHYISFCFRFRNSLGDFQEANSKALPQDEQDKLLTYAKEQIESLKSKTKKDIVITADSPMFLSIVSQMNGVYTVFTKINKSGGVHMDYTFIQDADVFEQSFIDYYALSKGDEIYVCVGSYMYVSSFPLFAANITNKALYHYPTH